VSCDRSPKVAVVYWLSLCPTIGAHRLRASRRTLQVLRQFMHAHLRYQAAMHARFPASPPDWDWDGAPMTCISETQALDTAVEAAVRALDTSDYWDLGPRQGLLLARVLVEEALDAEAVKEVVSGDAACDLIAYFEVFQKSPIKRLKI
jgi:hypothetical protein